MQIAEATIAAAFENHHEIYSTGRGWPIPEIVILWRESAQSFAVPTDFAAFQKVYEGLKRWQVFRPMESSPTDRTVFDILLHISRNSPNLPTRRLSELAASDRHDLNSALRAAGGIKTTKFGPSLMAATKFLHFWNPRLFVIVDVAVMDSYVLRHGWIRKQISRAREEAEKVAPQEGLPSSGFRTNGLDYVDLLFWAGQVLKANPAIMRYFVSHVNKHANGQQPPLGYEQFEGAAVEWLLSGLVEVPPGGVAV